MTRCAIGLLAAMLGGCMTETGGPGTPGGGGGGITPQPATNSLVGNWINQGSAMTGSSYSFDTAGAYTHGFFRVAPDGLSADAEAEGGTYDASVPGNINFHASKSTCTGALALYHTSYAWNGAYLEIIYTDALVSFSKNTSMGGEVTLRLGCFDRMTGVFTPGPLNQL